MIPKLPEHFEVGDLVITTNHVSWNPEYKSRFTIVTEVDWRFERLNVSFNPGDQWKKNLPYSFAGFKLVKKQPKLGKLLCR